MRVMLVTPLDSLGGTEVATLITARALLSQGCEVIHLGLRGPLSKEFDLLNIPQFAAQTHSSNPLSILHFVLRAAWVIRHQRVDIIHAQMARPVPMLYVARVLALATRRTKLYWTSRGVKASTYQRICPLFNALGVRAIANCKMERDKLINHGFSPARVSYAYNAYRLSPQDRRASEPPAAPMVIGTLAALRPARRLDLFLQVAAQLLTAQDASSPYIFRIGGDGPERDRLEAAAEALGIADRVEFLGAVEDVSPFLQSLHIFVSSLVLEGDSGAGVSNAIVEAMVTNVPVCAFDAAAIGEIVIDGTTGRLIKPGDIEAMASAIANLAHEPGERRRLSNAAYKLVLQECDPVRYSERLICAYESL